MTLDSSSERFFNQTDKLLLDDLPQGKLKRPHLTYGVSEDLPEMLMTKYSSVRRDLPQSPASRRVKPKFAYSEFAFFGDKEVFDYSSVKPSLSIDMRNSYRNDVQLKSPYFKEYRKALGTLGFSRKEGMCSGLARLSSQIPKTVCRTVLPPRLVPRRRQQSASFEAKRMLRRSAETSRELEVLETQSSIADFELRRNLAK
jgi:hypothetical protein